MTNSAFIIDTDKYAGNFERDMCAYITGVVGDCEVGDNYAEIFNKESRANFDNIEQKPDHNGCFRPCEMYLSPNKEYNSVAIYFEDIPTKRQISFMKKRAEKFATLPDDYGFHPTKILGYRLVKSTTTSEVLEC